MEITAREFFRGQQIKDGRPVFFDRYNRNIELSVSSTIIEHADFLLPFLRYFEDDVFYYKKYKGLKNAYEWLKREKLLPSSSKDKFKDDLKTGYKKAVKQSAEWIDDSEKYADITNFYGHATCLFSLWESRQKNGDAQGLDINPKLKIGLYEYYDSDHWKILRGVKLWQAKYRCELCNKENISLQVHHRTYERKKRELLSDLTILCVSCHGEYHGDKWAFQRFSQSLRGE